MVTLDQVEKLRKRANVSYDEAKTALEETNGDILEAIINLEKKNRVEAPQGGGYYNSKESFHDKRNDNNVARKRFEQRHERRQHFKETIHDFLRWVKKMIGKGNRNHFEVNKNGSNAISVPVTILVIGLCFAFWVIVPLLVLGLFFGYRYSFAGPDLGKDGINRAMDSAAKVAENLKKDVKGENSNEENPDN